MSKIHVDRIKCPKCGSMQEVTMWDSVNVSLNKSAKEKIMNNKFFYYKCDKCGYTTPIAYPCLYNDMDKEIMLYVIPGSEKESSQKMKKLLMKFDANMDRKISDKYIRRFVPDSNVLREKILINDHGKDDRVVELLKLFYLIQMEKSLKGQQILNIFYEIKNRKECFVIFVKGKKPIFIEIDPGTYERVKKGYLAIIEKNTPKGFSDIDFNWAQKIFTIHKRNKIREKQAR